MIDVTIIILGIILGMATGFFYFGSLYLTVRRLPRTKNPALLMFSSFLGRTVIAVAALFLILKLGDIMMLLAAVIGFIAMKLLFVNRFKPAHNKIESNRN